MRLSEVYFICKNALDNWIDPVFKEHVRNGAPNDYSLQNIEELREIINSLRQVDCLQETIADIGDKLHDLDEVPYHEYFDSSQRARGDNLIFQLREQIITICSLYESMGLSIEDDQTGFDVRLPDGISLEGISRCIEVLSYIDFYENYCKEHPEYENNRAVIAIQNIERAYQQHLEKNDFAK